MQMAGADGRKADTSGHFLLPVKATSLLQASRFIATSPVMEQKWCQVSGTGPIPTVIVKEPAGQEFIRN